MASNLFTVVGITVHADLGAKIRFANDLESRVKAFTKGGATRTDFILLPGEMTKHEALILMQRDPMFSNEDDQKLIASELAAITKKPAAKAFAKKPAAKAPQVQADVATEQPSQPKTKKMKEKVEVKNRDMSCFWTGEYKNYLVFYREGINEVGEPLFQSDSREEACNFAYSLWRKDKRKVVAVHNTKFQMTGIWYEQY